MKGKVMLEVRMVVRRQVSKVSELDYRMETEEVTFIMAEASDQEKKDFRYIPQYPGYMHGILQAGPAFVAEPREGEFTIALVDPRLFGTFKVGDKVDLVRALCTPETT